MVTRHCRPQAGSYVVSRSNPVIDVGRNDMPSWFWGAITHDSQSLLGTILVVLWLSNELCMKYCGWWHYLSFREGRIVPPPLLKCPTPTALHIDSVGLILVPDSSLPSVKIHWSFLSNQEIM
ncbi:hypothetical protein CEXT_726811 [Caerostris extrusa]|uniref:Uncharacterized protein n=1 Tax=Caerostris extrusa TaxID=172846 RepID=A0AAV4WDV4_CAEEX|nr:hypothetical protein CEXT_726811 [Caerostris extrusa]